MDELREQLSQQIANLYEAPAEEVRLELLRLQTGLADFWESESEPVRMEYAAGFYSLVSGELGWGGAREILARVGPKALAERIHIADVLSVEGPEQRLLIFSREELANRLKSLKCFLAEEETSLLATGLPTRPFEHSAQLGWWQSRLYPTKQTRFQCMADPTEPDPESDLDSDQELFGWNDWVRSPKPIEPNRRVDVAAERCSFSDANWIEGISSVFAKRLESLRPAVLKLKMAVLDILIESLQHPGDDIWTACRDVLHEMSKEDLRFCDELDQTYCEIPARFRELEPWMWLDRGYMGPMFEPGGVTNIIELIRHVEFELREPVKKGPAVGTMAQVREALGELCLDSGGDNVVQTIPEKSGYFGVLGTELRSPLDSAIDTLRNYHEHEKEFRNDFNQRVRAELFSARKQTIPSREPQDEIFAVSRRQLAETIRTELAAVNHQRGSSAQTDATGENVFRKSNTGWLVRYRGGETRAFAGMDGHLYLQRLLSQPGCIFSYGELYQEKTARTRQKRTQFMVNEDEARHESSGDLEHSPQTIRADQDPVIDREAIDNYKKRLKNIESELQGARNTNAQARVKKLEDERDAINRQLETSTGIGGRSKPYQSPLRNILYKVRQAINRSIEAIRKSDRELGQHLLNGSSDLLGG